MFDVYEPGLESTYLPFTTADKAAAFLGVDAAEVPKLAKTGKPVRGYCVKQRAVDVADRRTPTKCYVYGDGRCLLIDSALIGIPLIVGDRFFLNGKEAAKALGLKSKPFDARRKTFTVEGEKGRWAGPADVAKQYPGILVEVTSKKTPRKARRRAAKQSAAGGGDGGNDLIELAITYLKQDNAASALVALEMYCNRYGGKA